MKILACVVTYNRLDLLKECLDALNKQSDSNFDILVIDNCSSDGTIEYLKNNNINFIGMSKNAGGAGGFNKGLREAVERGYDYVWAMDDDTIPEPDCLEKLLLSVSRINGEFGFLSSYAKWTDNSACIMNIQEFGNVVKEKDVELVRNGIIPTIQASFVSLFIPVKIIEKVGLPIKDFFIWGDDTEYTKRISLKYPCYTVYESVVLHKMQNNNPTNIVTDNADRIERYKYAFRNNTFIARQYGKKAALLNNLSVFYQILKILKSDSAYKTKKIKVVFKGWTSGKRFNPQIEFCKRNKTADK